VTTVQGIDPRTGESVGEPLAETTSDEVERLLAAAHDAAGSYGASRQQVRAGFLRALADALDEATARLVPIAQAESGLPEARLTGEVARTSGQLRLFAEVVLDGAYLEVIVDSGDASATPPQSDLRRWLEPLGAVLVYAASNFPFAFSVLGGDTASALAAGCPVLLKAHPSHPATSAAVAELANEVVVRQGLPAGVFGMIVGDDQGVRALRDERITAAGFTGSTTGGRFLAGVAADRPRPIPFFGELGSINPAVVTAAAAAARGAEIARGFVASMTLGTGQFCTKPGLLFLPTGHGMDDALVGALTETAPAPMLNARIRDQLASGLDGLAAHADVTIVAEASAAPSGGAWATPRLFRTSARALAADAVPLTKEYFGPNALLVEYDGERDLLAALRCVEGTLTATAHVEDGDTGPVTAVLDVLRQRAGRVIVNGWPTGVAVTWSMQHGGPWPATTDAAHTSVGATAIDRWLRPVCYQDVPERWLPEALREDNPWQLPRRVNGRMQTVR
jgi:NADP-dependent aldehyde dehydrogenase